MTPRPETRVLSRSTVIRCTMATRLDTGAINASPRSSLKTVSR